MTIDLSSKLGHYDTTAAYNHGINRAFIKLNVHGGLNSKRHFFVLTVLITLICYKTVVGPILLYSRTR